MNELTLGEKIRTYRKLLNLTQKELATLVNLSEKTISAYETNTNLPDISTISLLAEALQVNASVFINNQMNRANMTIIQIHPESYEDLLQDVVETLKNGKVYNFRGTTIECVDDIIQINHEGNLYIQSFYDGALNVALAFHNIMNNDLYRKRKKEFKTH